MYLENAFTLPAPKTSLSEAEQCTQTSDSYVFLITVQILASYTDDKLVVLVFYVILCYVCKRIDIENLTSLQHFVYISII